MSTRPSEPGSLGLVVERSPGASRYGHSFRDETLHGLWAELELTRSWRQFLGAPESFLRHLG